MRHKTLLLAAAVLVAVAILAPPPPAASQQPPAASLAAAKPKDKDCFTTDEAGRKWACSRKDDWSVNYTVYLCPIENRLPKDMYLECNPEIIARDWVESGKSMYADYGSAFDPAPKRGVVNRPESPRETCDWGCDGNTMSNVVVWDELWPEAWSCRVDGGDGDCRIVFDSNREVALVTRRGRRVLGDLAIKECSNNRWGWLPFGWGCTYPKHPHPYYGTPPEAATSADAARRTTATR